MMTQVTNTKYTSLGLNELGYLFFKSERWQLVSSQYFADNIFKYVFLNENFLILNNIFLEICSWGSNW